MLLHHVQNASSTGRLRFSRSVCRSAGESPNSGLIPFSSVNLYARLEDYEEIIAENVQVFPGVITDQELELIPLAEFPDTWNKAEIFNTPAQNL